MDSGWGRLIISSSLNRQRIHSVARSSCRAPAWFSDRAVSSHLIIRHTLLVGTKTCGRRDENSNEAPRPDDSFGSNVAPTRMFATISARTGPLVASQMHLASLPQRGSKRTRRHRATSALGAHVAVGKNRIGRDSAHQRCSHLPVRLEVHSEKFSERVGQPAYGTFPNSAAWCFFFSCHTQHGLRLRTPASTPRPRTEQCWVCAPGKMFEVNVWAWHPNPKPYQRDVHRTPNPDTMSRSRTRDFSRAVFESLSCHPSSHA